jgi:hypothetical protein
MTDAEYERLRREVERTRVEFVAVPWWRPLRRQRAAQRFKSVLHRGARWELNHPNYKLEEEP